MIMAQETTETSIAVIKHDISGISSRLQKVDQNINKLMDDSEQIKQIEIRLTMVEKLVYGLLAIVLTSVFGALMALVIRQQ